MHGGVGLQSGQAQVTALGFEGHWVSNDVAQAEAGVEFAEVDVPVLAHVDVLHAVELKALRKDKDRVSNLKLKSKFKINVNTNVVKQEHQLK